MNLIGVCRRTLRVLNLSLVLRMLVTRVSRIILRVFARGMIKDDGSFATIYFGGSRSRRELVHLAEKYGTDKDSTSSFQKFEWRTHNYCSFYDLILAPKRVSAKFIFECGIGTTSPDFQSSMGQLGTPGASLRMWRDYFVSAEVHGADIDPDILFEEDRIFTHQLDQTSKSSIQKLWLKLSSLKFDVIIDDGLHTSLAGLTLLENSLEMLTEDGIYIIEDVSFLQFNSYKKKLSSMPLNFELIVFDRKCEDSLDNNLLVIRKRSDNEV